MSFHSGMFGSSPSHSEEVCLQTSDKEEEEIIIQKKKKKKKKRDVSSSLDSQPAPYRPFMDTAPIIFPNAVLDEANASDVIAAPLYTPYDADDTDWDSVRDYEGSPEDKEYCAFCENAQNEQQREANPCVQEIIAHVEENYYETERVRLASQTQNLYETKIQKYTKEKRNWHKKQIMEHFENHAFSPAIIKGIELRTLSHALKVMRQNSLFRKDAEGRASVDSREIKLYLEIMKVRNGLMDSVQSYKKQKL